MSSSDLEEEFRTKITGWIAEIMDSPKNLASETELREQGKVALRYFIEYDIDHTNTLTFDELKLLCDQLGLPVEKDEEEMLLKLDQDGSGALDLFEFISWWLKRISVLPNPMKQQEAIAKYTFGKYDADRSGFLDHQELKKLIEALGAEFTDEEIDQAIAEIDADGSGVIECSEFILWWTNRTMNNRQSSSLVSLKLKKLAAKANQMFATDIFTAAWKLDRELLMNFLEAEERLLQSSDENDYGGGWTIFHYLSYRGAYDLLATLLERYGSVRCPVNTTNNEGFTPLFYAAQQGYVEIVQLLLENGADPTIYGRSTITTFDAQSEDSQSTIQFMSPVEFILDYPKLKPFFLNHDKCRAPKRFLATDYQVAVHRSQDTLYYLTLTLCTPLKTLSLLPIRSYRLQLAWKNQEIFIAAADQNLLVTNLSKLIAAMAPSLHEDIVIDVPAIDPQQVNQYHSSTIPHITLDMAMIQCLQVIYYTTIVGTSAIIEIQSDSNKTPSASLVSLARSYVRVVGRFYYQTMTKIQQILEYSQTQTKNKKNLFIYCPAFVSKVEETFSQIFDRITSQSTSISTNPALSAVLEMMKFRLQEILDVKREHRSKVAAKINPKSAGDAKASLRDEETKTAADHKASMSTNRLSLEDLKECIDELVATFQPPPAPAQPKHVDQQSSSNPNIASLDVKSSSLAEAKQEAVNKSSDRKVQSKTANPGKSGVAGGSSVVLETDQFQLIHTIPNLEFSVQVIASNVLHESEASDPKTVSFNFPLHL